MLDLTSQWAFIQRHKSKAGSVLLALVMFAAGWQLGKVTSPYYAAHPIVFEDRECSACSSSGGSTAELRELKEAGQAAGQASAPPTPTAGTAPATVPAVAGSSDQPPEPQSAAQKTFVGSVNSNLYHLPDCSSAGRIKEENEIWFASEDEARAAGYTPSKCTQDRLGI